MPISATASPRLVHNPPPSKNRLDFGELTARVASHHRELEDPLEDRFEHDHTPHDRLAYRHLQATRHLMSLELLVNPYQDVSARNLVARLNAGFVGHRGDGG